MIAQSSIYFRKWMIVCLDVPLLLLNPWIKSNQIFHTCFLNPGTGFRPIRHPEPPLGISYILNKQFIPHFTKSAILISVTRVTRAPAAMGSHYSANLTPIGAEFA